MLKSMSKHNLIPLVTKGTCQSGRLSVRSSSVLALPSSVNPKPPPAARKDDFTCMIDEYAERIRSEGQKALQASRIRIQSQLRQDIEGESRALKRALEERDASIQALRTEIDGKKETVIKLSKQLRSMADLLGKRSFQGGSDDELVKWVVNRWLMHAKQSKTDKEGYRFSDVLYQTKLAMRVYNAWRLRSCIESMERSTCMRLEVLEKSKDALISQLTNERDREREALLHEQYSRQESMSRIKSLLTGKLEGLSEELFRAVELPS